MSKTGQDFIGLLPNKDTRPPLSGAYGTHNLFRDQLTISTWLCLGAIAQGVAFSVIGRVSLIPAVAVILYRVFDTYAMTVGWKRNIYMDNVLLKKFTAQFPDSEGKFGNKPADKDVVVFLLGTRSNHPLGLFAPGVQQMAKYFESMNKELQEHGEDYGFLGMTSWLNSDDRAAGSEIMTVCYFRNPEGLHAFAHSKLHREAWNWWNRETKKQPHIAIWHETYHVPKGHYENIYLNSHISGINTTAFKVTDKDTGAVSWASPVVEAGKGRLKTMGGRMSTTDGTDHDKYGADLY